MPMSPRLLRPRTSGIIAAPRFNGIGAWFDATDSSSYTLDTGVSEWRCKAVSGQKFSQTTGASQPTINSTGVGGNAALSFNGSSQWMNLGSQTIGGNDLFMDSDNAFTLCIICERVTSNTVFAKASGGAGRTLQLLFAGSGNNDYQVIARTGSGASVAAIATNTACLMQLEYNGSTATARLNNTSGSVTVGTAAIESENVLIGARTTAGPGNFFKGSIGEILFYNRILTGSERSALFSYLNAKWGLSLT